MKTFNVLNFATCILMFSCFTACEELIEIEPPRTELVKATVFTSDEPANAAVLDMYFQMHNSGFASGDFRSISLIGSLSADELINGITWDPNHEPIGANAIRPENAVMLTLWTDMYRCIFKANAATEGLAVSDGITTGLLEQLEGEAKFLRAFSYFYLVNLWGDVPLVMTTDYKFNQDIGRTAAKEVYTQIISDLKDAEALLPADFSHAGNERVRVNASAASAMLSRAYLFQEDWANAEAKASAVIENTSMFNLVPLSEVFRKNSSEAIFQLLPNVWGNTHDVETFLFYGHRISQELMASFETGDERRAVWTENGIFGAFDYPVKYKDYQNNAVEYTTVLRLAEQFLIRAEARTQQGDLVGAQSDLNAVRVRAGLPETTANDEITLLAAIARERRVELFTEWGHRWLDLKRTNSADAALAPLKVDWQKEDVLYPIPENQILNDPAMRNAQNPGY
jgi:starch-binding outer membrane protein, SusD/RagB family